MANARYGHRRFRSRPLGRWFAFLSVVFVIWVAGLIWFVETLPNAVDDPVTRTDAIVVLTGGSGRLEEGLELLDRGFGRKLYVSGVFPGMDVQRLLDVFREGDRFLENRVNIGRAHDTITNAQETEVWMRQNSYQDLRLVTSAYHMPRALMEFQAVNADLTVVPHPIFTDNVKQEDWWAWPGTTSLMIGEYNKFLLAWVRLKVEAFAATITG